MAGRRQTTGARRRTARRERAAQRALARSAVYRLLSQTLVYPSAEAVSGLREDLAQALVHTARLPDDVASLVTLLAEQLEGKDAAALQSAHGHTFSHVQSADCPPCETTYTAKNVFQETQELSDLAGFFRAFGLELAERERPDHISVELEFMYVLTFKEAYALLHHGMEKARLCRIVERKFMQDHLGRWGRRFAELLARKAGSGHFASVASLVEAFLAAELAVLRARPEAVVPGPQLAAPEPDDFVCPLAQGGPVAAQGDGDAPA